MNFLTNLNLSQNQIQNALMHPLGTPPTGVESQVYYNLTDHLLYVHNGTTWVAVGAPYTLPTATDTVLGAVKVGTGLSIDGSGVLTANLRSVKVNGSALTISSNAVDILIATGTTNGTIKVNNIDVAVYGLQSGAFATAYIHPNHTGDVTSTGDGATTIGANKVTNAMLATVATNTFKGRKTASTGNVEDLTVADVKTLLGLALTQTALATGFSIAGGTTSKTLTVSNTMTLAGTDGSTLNIGTGGTLGTGAFAAAYVHPTGDGNLHVPATSTTNNGKVLTAGATAGSLSWVTPTVYEAVVSLGTANQIWGMNNAGTAKEWKSFSTPGTTGTAPNWVLSTANQINLHIPMASAGSVTAGLLSNTDYGKIHTQNTDTGTTSSSFTIGTSGVKIKNSGGTELQIRNNGDTAYADLRVNNLVVEGTTTTINSNTVDIGDSNITLNSDITTSAANSNGGISVKRLMADNTTRKDAVLEYNISTDKWQTTTGAVASTLVTLPLTNKYSVALGNGTDTAYVITHNLNTRDIAVTIRETGDNYEQVIADVEFTSVNTLTVRFATAPTTSQYTLTAVG